MTHQRKCDALYKLKYLPRNCTCALQANLLRSLLRVRARGSILEILETFLKHTKSMQKKIIAPLQGCKGIDRLGLPARFFRIAVPYQSIAQSASDCAFGRRQTTHCTSSATDIKYS